MRDPLVSAFGVSTMRKSSQGGVITCRFSGREKKANTSLIGRGSHCSRSRRYVRMVTAARFEKYGTVEALTSAAKSGKRERSLCTLEDPSIDAVHPQLPVFHRAADRGLARCRPFRHSFSPRYRATGRPCPWDHRSTRSRGYCTISATQFETD